jgi:hypothetical protein
MAPGPAGSTGPAVPQPPRSADAPFPGDPVQDVGDRRRGASGRFGFSMSAIAPEAHRFTQRPQPRHRFSMTRQMSPSRSMAFMGQIYRQVPQPVQRVASLSAV